MTLKMLGEEYLAGEALIRNKIRALRAQLPQHTGDSLKEMQARIRSLYEMALQAGQTGRYLIGYYDRSSDGCAFLDGCKGKRADEPNLLYARQ